MINQLALYPNTIDSDKLEDLLSRQIDSMKKAKGLQEIKVSKDNLMSPGGPSSFAKVLETTWESLETLMAWVQNQTPADNADKEYLLKNGAILLFYEVKDHN